MNWVRVTSTDGIPPREGRVVTIHDRQIAVFNLVDRFAAIENRCPHSGGPLCDGILSGAAVVCPLHGWKISLDTGEILRGDTSAAPVEMFPAKIEQGIVMLEVASNGRQRRVA